MVRLSMTKRAMFVGFMVLGGLLIPALPVCAHGPPGGLVTILGLFIAPGFIGFIFRYFLKRTRFLAGAQYSAASLFLLTAFELIVVWTCHFKLDSVLSSHADVKVMSYVSGNLALFWYLSPLRSSRGAGLPVMLVAFAIGFVPNLMLLKAKGEGLFESMRESKKLLQASVFALIIPAIVGMVFARPLILPSCWRGSRYLAG